MRVKELSTWPLLLCGPMLRRVEPSGVSVFVALKHSRDVTLTVYSGTSVVARGGLTTIALGAYLHAAVVTALPTAGIALVPGKVYTYDVEFSANAATDVADTDRATKSLASDGLAGPGSLLKGVLAIGYSPDALPGFSLPPLALQDLKLAHASCRKAHGEGVDALPILDTIIRSYFQDPLGRPHQLFLTGDQIYADDVATPLLKQLSAVGALLLGWSEALPPRVEGGDPPTESELAPGIRDHVLKPPLTSGEAQCHLIKLGEFYAIYLFFWSDALWPDAFEQLPLLTNLEMLTTPFAGMEQRLRQDHNDLIAQLQSFRNALGKVRRALANVPSYMICDDHEVTDDWYLHRAQREGILESPLARRVVSNALSAYTVFQAWGNDPATFTPATLGGLFLSSLSGWRGGEAESSYSDICNALGTSSLDTPPALRFDYAVSGPAHDVIVIDTRTRRGYPQGSDMASVDLLTLDEIKIQIGNRIPTNAVRKPLTVLISPAPVFGHPLPEWIQETASHTSFNTAATAVDRETWLVPHRRQCFEELLHTLVPCSSVLILSGDVHYGFSLGVRYWDDRTLPGRRAAFVQLVGSSLKNQSGMGQGLAGLGAPIPQVFLGWPTPGEHIGVRFDVGSSPTTVDGTPAVRRLRNGDSIIDPPQWRYSSGWLLDSRPFSPRTGLPGFVGSGGNFLARQGQLALEHRRMTMNDQMRAVVGNNNVATLRFAATPATTDPPAILVQHALWYRLKDVSDDPLPYTIHWADLSPPLQEDPRPGSAGSVATPPTTAEQWADLISFRPTVDLQNTVGFRNFKFQPIENGWGDVVNLDFYGIRIAALPTLNGVPLDARTLLIHIRQNLQQFVDLAFAEFMPYDPTDGTSWTSTSPYGSALDIAMKVSGTTVAGGTVVVTDAADDHWIFSTVWSPRDWWFHPVSGNRRFGYVADGTAYIFFTQGADRTSMPYWSTGSPAVFSGAHGLWKSFQQAVSLFVNDNGGVAEIQMPTWERFNWPGVKAAYHRPTRSWTT